MTLESKLAATLVKAVEDGKVVVISPIHANEVWNKACVEFYGFIIIAVVLLEKILYSRNNKWAKGMKSNLDQSLIRIRAISSEQLRVMKQKSSRRSQKCRRKSVG